MDPSSPVDVSFRRSSRACTRCTQTFLMAVCCSTNPARSTFTTSDSLITQRCTSLKLLMLLSVWRLCVYCVHSTLVVTRIVPSTVHCSSVKVAKWQTACKHSNVGVYRSCVTILHRTGNFGRVGELACGADGAARGCQRVCFLFYFAIIVRLSLLPETDFWVLWYSVALMVVVHFGIVASLVGFSNSSQKLPYSMTGRSRGIIASKTT